LLKVCMKVNEMDGVKNEGVIEIACKKPSFLDLEINYDREEL